ncbi:MAG: SDR family oxidoreductase [Simkaniaceae bacterium]|nr:SDR family oxidoreductase [Simkaniaceae bacterium]
MDLGITGKIVMITASGRGLGRAIAKKFAVEGARVIINSRSESDLKELLNELSEISVGHSMFCSDLTTPGAPEDLCDFLKGQNLNPDILVHNLGGNLGITDPFCPVSDWHKVMRVNLDVQITINNALIPYMIKNKWGRVCHVSSVSALENHGPPTYCAAKAALTAYVRSFGRYVAKHGVVLSSILPGAVLTQDGYWDEAQKNRPEHVEKYLRERMAIQRFGSPEEIADVVTFLCSASSSFCVGSSFVIDGGQGRSFYLQDS